MSTVIRDQFTEYFAIGCWMALSEKLRHLAYLAIGAKADWLGARVRGVRVDGSAGLGNTVHSTDQSIDCTQILLISVTLAG